MKANKKLTVVVVVTILAVLVASQSVNQAAVREKVKRQVIKPKPSHPIEDVELLMKSNHWTKERAVRVLDLSSQ